MNHPHIHRIERLALLLVGLATLASLLTWDLRMIVGVALGGLLGVGNFYALRRIVQSLMEGKSGRMQTAMAVLLTLKFGLLAAVIYLIVRFVPVSAGALLIGVSVVVISIFIEGFRTALRGAEPQSE